jgi:hypothetical protein
MNIQAIARTRIPNAALKLLLRCAKTVAEHETELTSASVEAARAELVAHIATIDAALAARLRAKNPRLLALELEFDRAVDSLWIFLRKLLELCAQAYGHAGLELLSPERRAELELDLLRALAKQAAALYEQLFAAEGTSFVKLPFPEQAESMATLLRIIEEDGLDDDLHAVTGKLLLRALKVCQAQYEELVGDRMQRELGVLEDFRELRGELRWRLDRYKVALELLHDPDEPKTLAIIEETLRPVLLLSAHMTRGGSGEALDEELDAALVESELFDALEQLGEGEAHAEGEGEAHAEGEADLEAGDAAE